MLPHSPSVMASVEWRDLPGDVLLVIVKLLGSDIDHLRLRSVCSSWRSSLPTRTKPYSFPMKLPPLSSVSDSIITQRSTDEHVSLCQSSLYRLSLPEHAGDPSDGWLLRVSEVRPNSNTFSLLTPLLPERIDCSPDVIPKGLNLLDFRISEVCKCYHLTRAGSATTKVKKAIVLSGFLPDCDFAVLVLGPDNFNGCLSYWKFGDEFWTPVDTKDYQLDDVILFNGRCYAVGWRGELVSFDSEFNMTPLVPLYNTLLDWKQNHFVVHKSYLYIVAKGYFRDPVVASWQSSDSEAEDDSEESEAEEAVVVGLRVRANIIKISNCCMTLFKGLEDISNCCMTLFKGLKDDVFFLSSDDLSVGLSTKDFGGCKGNCVYMAHGGRCAVFDFDTLETTSLTAETSRDRAKIYWPPPDWLYHNSGQDPRPVHE